MRIRCELEERTEPDDLPDELNGIPIEYVRKPPSQDAATCSSNNCCVKDFDYAVHGGLFVTPESGNDGVTCCKVDYDGNIRMMTVAHLWGECGETISGYSGDIIQMCNEGSLVDVGQQTFIDKDYDVALFDGSYLGPNQYFSNEIVTKSDSTTVNGYVAESGIDKMASDTSFTVYQQGCCTGKTSGPVAASNYNADCSDRDFDGHGVLSNPDFGNGDSGGPVWYTDSNGDSWLVHLSTRYHCPQTCDQCDCSSLESGQQVSGISAYRLHDVYGMTFGKGNGPAPNPK